MTEQLSRIVKAGSRTFSSISKKPRIPNPFLVITQSQFKGEGEERERSSIVLFPEHVLDFAQALQDLTEHLDQQQSSGI